MPAEPFEGDQTVLDKSITTLETRASPIIRQIRNGQFQISIEERYHLANFIGIQLGRVPIFHRHINNNIDDTPNRWLQEYVKDDNKLQQRFGANAELFKAYVLSDKLKARVKFKDDAHRQAFIISLAINLGLEFAQLIFGMRWIFLLASGDATFFASDNPARLMSPGAMPLKIKFDELNEELEISFPISATCTLWMHSHDIAQNPHIGFNEVTKIDEDNVNKTNWKILPTIDRCAFCSTEEQARWILEQTRSKLY